MRPRASPSPAVLARHIDTPPREVILTPRATPKPVRRRPASRPKRAPAKVKSEPPEIHLSRVRSPSPSDDPLLLLGTPPPTRSPPLRSRLTPVFSSSPDAAPSLSFADRLFDSGRRASTSAPTNLSVFGAPRAVATSGGAWSDSDDDEFNLTGEYTGKYKLLKVPTKVDPPARPASWGRPVSPFPYSEIMERSLPLADVAEGDSDDAMDTREDADAWEVATEPPLSETEHSPPPPQLPPGSEDEFAALDDDFLVFAESTLVPVDERLNSDQTTAEDEEEEAQIDRELSVAIDDGPGPTIQVNDDGSSDEEDDVEGEDIIKITSDDPKAAARAAAILKMHDYDCILAAEKRKRSARSTKSTRQRRRTVENVGISKSYVDPKSQRWQTLQPSPGSRSLPLLELWRDAEDSVFLEHHSVNHCDTSFTLSPLRRTTTPSKPSPPPLTGEWTRDCWKRLDKCLTAERLAVAVSLGLGADLLADLVDISKDAVLDRFADQFGGKSVLDCLGAEWSRDNLMLRLDVLFNKRQTRRLKHSAHEDLAQPRYRGLLQEAMALAGTPGGYATDPSLTSENMFNSEWSSSSGSWHTGCAGGPIRTPSRSPELRSVHPKDQVHLRHAPAQYSSRIPVPIRPKRLVDLRHRSPTKTDRTCRPARRSSGCSVKDLVRQFEGLDK